MHDTTDREATLLTDWLARPAQKTGWPAGDREEHLPTVSLPPAKKRKNHRQSKEQHKRKLREESDSTII